MLHAHSPAGRCKRPLAAGRSNTASRQHRGIRPLPPVHSGKVHIAVKSPLCLRVQRPRAGLSDPYHPYFYILSYSYLSYLRAVPAGLDMPFSPPQKCSFGRSRHAVSADLDVPFPQVLPARHPPYPVHFPLHHLVKHQKAPDWFQFPLDPDMPFPQVWPSEKTARSHRHRMPFHQAALPPERYGSAVRVPAAVPRSGICLPAL